MLIRTDRGGPGDRADHGLGARARPRARALLGHPAHARGRLPRADRARSRRGPRPHQPAASGSADEHRRERTAAPRRRPRRLAGPLRAARLLAQPRTGLLRVPDADHVPRHLRLDLRQAHDRDPRRHRLQRLLRARHPRLRDHRDDLLQHGDQHRDPARQRRAEADAGHAAARAGPMSPAASARRS